MPSWTWPEIWYLYVGSSIDPEESPLNLPWDPPSKHGQDWIHPSMVICWFFRQWILGVNHKLEWNTSSTAQGGGGSFKNRKPIGEACCCGAKMAERTHWWIERWLCVSAFLSAVARTKQAAATPWGRHVGGMGRVTFLHVFLYFWRHDGARQHSGSRRFLSAVARTKLPRHREADTSEGWVTLNFFMFFCTIITVGYTIAC